MGSSSERPHDSRQDHPRLPDHTHGEPGGTAHGNIVTDLVAIILSPQTIPLPQLRREDGHLLYLAAGGPFTLRCARGTITNERVVELRDARVADRTGPLDSYNYLASQLPQDTRVLYYF